MAWIRRMAGAVVGGALIVTLQAGPAAAATPTKPGCMGADTSVGAKQGVNGALRSSLAKDGESVFGAGVKFGTIVQWHQAGYLGGSCGS